MSAGAAMLEQIRQSPDDDRLRAVYADWLLQQTDEASLLRGEFINLQLSGSSDPAREAHLLRLQGTVWTEKLWKIIVHPAFRRGFLSSCRLSEVPDWAIGHPVFSTVEALELDDSGNAERLLAHPVMRSLRKVSTLSHSVRGLCQTGVLPRLEVLGLRVPLAGEAGETLEKCVAWPRLRTVNLYDSGAGNGKGSLTRGGLSDLQWLVKSPLRSQLHSVTAAIAGWRLSFSCGPEGRLSVLVAQATTAITQPRRALAWLAAWISSDAPAGLTRLEVSTYSDVSVTVEDLAPLHEAIAAHPQLLKVFLPTPKVSTRQKRKARRVED